MYSAKKYSSKEALKLNEQPKNYMILNIPTLFYNKKFTSTVSYILAFLLVIVISNNLAQLSWQIILRTNLFTISNHQPVRAINKTELKKTNRKSSQQYHNADMLFGSIGQTAKKDTSTDDTPFTSLNLILQGVVAFADKSQSFAIIKEEKK